MYDDSEARDEAGRWTDGGSSGLLGAHERMDKLAANAHAKAASIKPKTYEVSKLSNGKFGVHEKGDTRAVPLKTKTEALATRDRYNAQEHKAVANYHAERTSRSVRAQTYLRARAGREAKYGKQLKFGF